MPLSHKDLSDIAKEYGVARQDLLDDKTAIPNIQDQIVKKQEQADRMYILYNNAQVERATPYETEHRWIDGTTYTTITQNQIETVGTDGRSAYFFPVSWQKSNAQLQPNGNGNPKTTSPNSESTVLSSSIENQGLISQINLLRNGQTSGVIADDLDLNYSPGNTTIEVNNLGHTNGNLLYISGSGTSALVRITNVVGTTLTITEIIPPENTIIAISSSVIENISGFSNSERNTLVSATYQHILTELTNRIISAAGLWNTALTNQLAQLNINIDAPSQIVTAKTNVNTAITAYNAWFALSNTGASGKFVDTSLNNLAIAYNARLSQFSNRVTEITTALGAVSQDGEGNYSGNGVYLQRYKTMNFLINTSNGPLFQLNGLRAAKTNFEQRVANTTDKLATFSNVVRYAAFTEDSMVSTLIKVDAGSLFTNGDTVLLTGNDLPAIETTISSITGNSIVLNTTVPKEYTKAAKAAIIKAI